MRTKTRQWWWGGGDDRGERRVEGVKPVTSRRQSAAVPNIYLYLSGHPRGVKQGWLWGIMHQAASMSAFLSTEMPITPRYF
jgi:hypothetical protein